MKNSKYNITCKACGENIVFNTLHQTLIKIDRETLLALKNEDYYKIDEKDLNTLITNGFIIEDDSNELDIFQYYRHELQYNYKKLHILYTITDFCNSNCEYCFKKIDSSYSIHPKKALDIRKFIVKQALLNLSKIIQIDFFGGEPLLFENRLMEEIRYFNQFAQKNNLYVRYRFYTNGTILSNDFLSFLESNKEFILDLQITLDGPKDIHDSIRPLKSGKSAYNAIIKNLKKLNTSQIPVQIRINFNKSNFTNIELLLDELCNMGLEKIPIYFYAVQSMSASCSNYANAIADEDTIKLFPYLWRLAIKKKMNINLRPTSGFVYCSASCKSSFVINYKGEIYKCALLQTDKRYLVGEIGSDGNISNPKNEFYKWMCRNPLLNEKCRICKLLPVCGGGCGGSAVEKYGDYYHSNCFDMNINLFKERLSIYYTQKYFNGESNELSQNSKHRNY